MLPYCKIVPLPSVFSYLAGMRCFIPLLYPSTSSQPASQTDRQADRQAMNRDSTYLCDYWDNAHAHAQALLLPSR